MSTVEELQRQLDEVLQVIAAQNEQKRREQEQERRETEQLAARVAMLEQAKARTRFLDYIRITEKHVFSKLGIELATQTSKAASDCDTLTCIDGMVYPLRFCPWTDFAATHAATLDELAAAFGDQQLFLAERCVESMGTPYGFESRYDELDLRSFINLAVEMPAFYAVTKYLRMVKHPTLDAVKFRSNADGLGNNDAVGAGEIAAIAANGNPDCWGIAFHRDGTHEPILVGEDKAAHQLHAEMLEKVLSAPPGEDFFARVLKHCDVKAANKAAGGESPITSTSTSTNVAHGSISVAQALCQVYHYMIASGVEYGYVSSGDGFVFLRVLKDEPRTLYYHWSVFPLASTIQSPAGAAGVADAPAPADTPTRAPQHTAMAYITSLCVWALRSTPRAPDWADKTLPQLAPWPQPYEARFPSLPTTIASLRLDKHDDTDSDGRPGAAAGPSRPATAQLVACRDHDPGYLAYLKKRFVAEPPTLPYCTQGCLLGLSRGLPLDEKCPNVELHRSAAHAAAVAAGQEAPPQPIAHALTADQLQALVVAQLARSMSKDCECMDKYGCYGRWGVLFRLTVTGYGYTLVAKGVQAVHRYTLEHEAALYTNKRLAACQGQLIPVFLGLIDLERPIPLRSLARVAHMMLMSYAGPSLNARNGKGMELVPPGVDLEIEEERIEDDLLAAGLWNDDVRGANMSWNTETGRLMQYDFGLAYMMNEKRKTHLAFRSPSPSPSRSPSRSPSPSPLLEKRNDNDNDSNDNGNSGYSPEKRQRLEICDE